jgi:hypothetical protein
MDQNPYRSPGKRDAILRTTAIARGTQRMVVVQAVIVAILLVAAQGAMCFRPYERIYSDGVYSAPHSLDAVFPWRTALVAFGLIASLVSIGVAVASFIGAPRDLGRLVAQLCGCLCVLNVGWKSMPYWANGMYQAYRGHAPVADFDPKALIPMVWIGDFWRLAVLLIDLATLFGAPCLLILVLGRSMDGRCRLSLTAFSLLCLSVSVCTFVFSPRYHEWLFD